ncbi:MULTISPECIES: MarR family winged helix-turn-helix transcriptional regulator [unclassified Microbacterium]|uniref:MarR family winged helix-turn-helix transcriptional regulator n=1 Tax=unclassified Microbacterium TaxID=2609290 RepID=UPI001604FD94|nr:MULTISPECIES: MarR family transcriptional regulator [unclassified Microbacterium]QNA93840.1 MarR family transcriptional regulator [Microbacterium sp. Se63.02b]QYM64136.1 MarR family transcriptional regulator [Microbacterium sp. Se5.02b]
MDPLLLDRLLQIGDLFQRDMARAFEGTGLTTARVHLLWTLQHAGPSTQKTLARLCEVSPRNITGLVDALEATGHVRRTPHPSDRRAVLVELTASASETMAQMQKEHTDLNATLLAAVAPEDRDAVERGVSAIAAHLEQLVAQAAGEPTKDAP